MSRRPQVTELNPHLSCILCGGYFVDATTVTECLHSFCRACIVRYLETSNFCPVCEVQVHKSRPLHYIRSDKMLQDIVYKLVPGLFHNEMKRRRELYASQPPEALKESRDAEDRGECLDEKFIYAPDEIFSLSVEYGSENDPVDASSETDDMIPKRRFLRCPGAVTVGHLKKFIRMKYGIPNCYEIDVHYDTEILREDYSLMDVAYIFLWKRIGPMRFFYKIVERPPKIIRVDPIPMETDVSSEDSPNRQIAEEPVPPPKKTKEEAPPVSSVTPVPLRSPPPPTTTEQARLDPLKIKIQTVDEKSKKNGSDVKKVVEVVSVKSKDTGSSKKEHKSMKFLPTSSSHSESKPVVMTVAPLTKPSCSLPTTSTTSATGTITHGLYTGISIKKSPPNTIPTFQVSSHLSPPRVPPLKLSPPRFSKTLETCVQQLQQKDPSKKSSSSSPPEQKIKKLKIEKAGKTKKTSWSEGLEAKVAQLKSAAFQPTVKSVAPLVITMSHFAPKAPKDSPTEQKVLTTPSTSVAPPPTPPPKEESKESPAEPPKESTPSIPVKDLEDDKMDLDSDLFDGPLVIAEPDPISSKDESSDETKPPEQPQKDIPKDDESNKVDEEDELIDVVDESDSGRGSDISRRSLCGDEDLGSPDSVPKTPESDHKIPEDPALPKANGASTSAFAHSSSSDVLDLTCGSRKRGIDAVVTSHRSMHVANPAVLDKTRQTTPYRLPEREHSSFRVLSAVLPHVNLYKNGGKANPPPVGQPDSANRNFKCRGNTLTVINPDPSGVKPPKIVIRNLGPKPPHDRFHHHHHHHRMQKMYK